MDMRGARHVADNARGLVKIAGYNVRKLYRWIRLTGGAPALSGKDPAGHMLYFRNERPDIYERTYKFLNVLDYLNLRLTGRFVATYDSWFVRFVAGRRLQRDERRAAEAFARGESPCGITAY
jgi:xylulokinase